MMLNSQRIRVSVIANLIFVSFVLASSVLAQAPGTFIPTGSMTTARFFHTATLLADGRVLIAGGQRIDPGNINFDFTTLSSAEIYDPRTGTFTATGNMTTARWGQTATLLPNGKVLIAAGGSISAELYDPDAGIFTPTGNMTRARGYSIGTLLANGKVLIVGGGYTGASSVNGSAEVYDPSTGTFAATGDMHAKFADTATLLPNGKVLITEADSDPNGPPPFLKSAELYDPSTGAFSSAGHVPGIQNGATAVLLTNGRVLVAGGGDDVPSVGAEIYDSATGTFTPTGNMIAGRDQNTASLLQNGTVLMAGGHEAAVQAEFYDPIYGIFTGTGNMAGPRELHTATLLNDGRVLIAGGDNEIYWSPQTILATAELYIPPPDQWQQAITALKTAAGTDSYNFWQWDWLWQRTPSFPGAPASFGVLGSIDSTPGLIGEIIAAGGGNGIQNISAEQWVAYYRHVIATDPWQQAIARMQASAGTDSYNFWQWAWFWQRSLTFTGAPAGFGALGSIDNTSGFIGNIIAAGGGNGFAVVSAQQWVLYYRQAASQ